MPVGNSIHKAASLSCESMSRAELNQTKKSLSDQIKTIQKVKKDIDKPTYELIQQIKSVSSIVKEIKSITKKHGDNSTIRLKNDQFKYGESSSTFKRLFNIDKNRIKAERQEAAKILSNLTGVEKESATSKELTLELNSRINDYNQEHDQIKEKLIPYEGQLRALNKELKTIVDIENKVKKADEEKLKARQDFCLVYQSNAGCKALNQEARKVFRKSDTSGFVSGSKVIQEYERVHGSEIFGRGNKDLKYRIKAQCDDLSSLVKEAAKGFYTPSSKTFTTFRGQGMTPSGIALLKEKFHANPNTVYRPGQFFSTSSKVGVANDFAKRSTDDIKVLFTVKGNSSNGLSVPGGLTFENDEGESLYSPLANFKVTSIQYSGGLYNVSLQETKQIKGAQLLPY